MMAIVAEVLRHRRMALAERESEALVEMVVGGNAVGDSLGVTKQDITANFRDQNLHLVVGNAGRNARGSTIRGNRLQALRRIKSDTGVTMLRS